MKLLLLSSIFLALGIAVHELVASTRSLISIAADISIIGGAVAAVIAAFQSWLNKRHVAENTERIETVHSLVSSKFSELVRRDVDQLQELSGLRDLIVTLRGNEEDKRLAVVAAAAAVAAAHAIAEVRGTTT